MPQSSFVSDSEIQASSFVSDNEIQASSFTPDSQITSEPEPEQGFLERHPLIRRFLTGPTHEEMGLPEEADVLGTPESEGSILPSVKGMADRRAAQGESFSPYWEAFAESLYEDVIRPFGSPSGLVGSSLPARTGLPKQSVYAQAIKEGQPTDILSIRQPAPRSEPLLLPEGRDPFIANEAGGVQRQSLITPQEEARLAGFEVGPEGPIGAPSETTARAVDLAELREAERLRALNFTDFEQQGGVALELPDRPLMDLPPTAGDTRLGFESMVPRSGELSYPLNIVPQAVQPRSAQTSIRALAGDDFARQVLPEEPITFESAPTPKPETPTRPTRDLRGGTAAIEPGEPILPSAAKRVKEEVKSNTGLNVGAVKVPKNTPTPVKAAVENGVKTFVKESANPSILFKSVYTQLSELGPAGKDLVHKFQRAAQNRSEYDSAWTEPLFKVGGKLKQNEFDNFGSYVEGRMPIPNDRVRAAVAEWNRAQNMMGDMAVNKGLNLKRGDGVVPFEKVQSNYWPHIPVEALTKKTIIQRLMEGDMSRHEAVQVAKRWENTGEIFLRSQHSRLHKKFQYRDDFDVAIHHGRSMSKRISNHEHLGPKDIAGKGEEGVANLIEDTADPDLAYKLAKRLAGRDELPNQRLVKGLNQSRKWMSLTSLPNFTIPNIILGQTTNAHMALLSRHPLKAVKEISKLFGSAYRDQVRASGAFNSFNRTLLEEVSGTDPFQIGAGEKINRSIAAAIGRSTVREAFTDYKAGQNMNSARYFLETLLARNPDSIQSITPEMERFAAGRMAEITQGLNNPGNLPYGWSNPINSYGSVATQLFLIFKKIGFQVTKTVKDTIKADPVVAIPLWTALTQVAGEMVADTKSLITGRERPEGVERIADNWGNAFMLGLPWELATSAQYGPTALIASAAGPAFSKASEFGYNVSTAAERLYNDKEDPFGPLRRFGLKNLPIPGRERIRDAVEED